MQYLEPRGQNCDNLTFSQETPFQGYMIKFMALTLWIGIFLAERSSGLSFIDEQEDDEEEMGESS